MLISNIYHKGSNAVEEHQYCKRNEELRGRGEVTHEIDISPSTTTAFWVRHTKYSSIQPAKIMSFM